MDTLLFFSGITCLEIWVFSILYYMICALFYFNYFIFIFAISVAFFFSSVTNLITYAAELLRLYVVILFLSVVNGLLIYQRVSKLEQMHIYCWETRQEMRNVMSANLTFWNSRNSSTGEAREQQHLSKPLPPVLFKNSQCNENCICWCTVT